MERNIVRQLLTRPVLGQAGRVFMAERRGPKAKPDQGLSLAIPCKLNAYILKRDKTQASIVEEMNSDPVILKYLGKNKMSRGTLAFLASGRMIPSMNMLVVLMHFFNCEAEDLYEPYIVAMISGDVEKWIKEGGKWNE